MGNMTIGVEGEKTSRGLFKKDDWLCIKCGNVNWQKRTTCNQCNNPREMVVEVRDG
jgi:hypothetical protein